MTKAWIPEDQDLRLISERFMISPESVSGLAWKVGRSTGKPALATLQSDGRYFRGNFTSSDGKVRQLLAHRVVHFLSTGEWSKGVIDHIDGNSLNNAETNLRDVSASGNLLNQNSRCYRFRTDLASGWEVSVQYRGVRYRSVCSSEEDAKREVKRLKSKIAPEMGDNFSWGGEVETDDRVDTENGMG